MTPPATIARPDDRLATLDAAVRDALAAADRNGHQLGAFTDDRESDGPLRMTARCEGCGGDLTVTADEVSGMIADYGRCPRPAHKELETRMDDAEQRAIELGHHLGGFTDEAFDGRAVYVRSYCTNEDCDASVYVTTLDVTGRAVNDRCEFAPDAEHDHELTL